MIQVRPLYCGNTILETRRIVYIKGKGRLIQVWLIYSFGMGWREAGDENVRGGATHLDWGEAHLPRPLSDAGSLLDSVLSSRRRVSIETQLKNTG